MFPQPNPAVLAEVGGADGVVYAMGSLYTSICPPLVLVGVGCTTFWNIIGFIFRLLECWCVEATVGLLCLWVAGTAAPAGTPICRPLCPSAWVRSFFFGF